MNKPRVCTVARDIRYIKLPFYGHISYNIRNDLNEVLHKIYPQVNFRFIFTNNRTIGSYFRVKDVIPAALRSGICYQYKCACSGCTSGYVGLSTRRLHTRVQEPVLS